MRSSASAIGRRLYAAQAAAAQKTEAVQASLQKEQPKISKLANGIQVVSVENFSPVSKVVVVYNAGARFESSQNLGVTHALRNAGALATKDTSFFGNVRNLESFGASLSATGTREHLIYTLDVLRNNFDAAMPFLASVVTAPVFNQWELDAAANRLKVNLAHYEQSACMRVMETVHAAAYRDTLGRSLYSPAYMVGRHDAAAMADHWGRYCTPGRLAVVGLGVSHASLIDHVSHRFTAAAGGASADATTARFGGGEIRELTGAPLAHAAVVAEGAAVTSARDVVALALLQKLLGAGPTIKYGATATTLTSSLAKVATGPFAASAVNASYTDSGVFGFYVVGQPADMAALLRAGMEEVRSLAKNGVTDQQLQQVKQQLAAAVLMEEEDANEYAICLATQALHSGDLISSNDVLAAIAAATAADVAAAAKRIVTGKLAMSAVGDLRNTPYLDELV
ncbi:PREDICTED: cytochrome b-c1 complex subunit 2, mitochondrial-like [Priapulus caudatus]|uniref:Cytochrome b-c1 complex subunit 2, mitochondrial-like n=1 Tax=Priapulus caudatus TaxID=37621 RepID=A0ABM1ERC8_PRICU|nr:PREDICTED: cytochrome b-c1 complex subunit 2, mitochondrial-like [Priapulus caudatus]XP_014674749.1 PREDICTED: cytochrome b-c1 complex subunit 2, mitochondrial-like [Priapulus caudatus]XP_014674751.1 PREDICTED: cytochrome b-c1 complex subunit 2, mitochondrial-like [Priapulus caudatus]